MLTKEERIAVVSARRRGMTYEQKRAVFACKFRKPGPTRPAIKNLVNKFQRTGSVADEERPGRPAVSPDTVQNVQNAITRSPSASTRRLSRELGIPQTTVWRTLRYKFHIQVKINSIQQLKQRIRAAAAKITPATMAPKPLYGRKVCELTKVLNPFLTHTFS